MKSADTYSSLVLVLLASVVCYLSKELSLWSPVGPSDGFFPFLGGLILGFLGLCLFIQSLLKPKDTSKVRGSIQKVKLFTYIGSVLLYPLLFESLGFPFISFFFILVICKVAEKASWRASLIISCLITISCFLIFQYVFEVPFPTGFLKGLTFLR